MKAWCKFLDLWEQSVIITGSLAILALLGIILLLALGRPIPEQLWMIAVSAIGFFFGRKAGTRQTTAKAE